MFEPSESDLPDAPLDNGGELQLPADLIAVADRLRREAVMVSEAAVPQAAAAPLLRHASERRPRQTWRQIALGIALVTVCTSFAAIAMIFRHAAELRRPLPNRSLPMIVREEIPDIRSLVSSRSVSRDVFLSADQAPRSESLEVDLAAAAGTLTAEQRIELLERALDSYRNALDAQNDRIQELEAELEAARMKRRDE